MCTIKKKHNPPFTELMDPLSHKMDMTASADMIQPNSSCTDYGSEYEMLRAVLNTRDSEIAILCARLQQNNDTLALVVERLEKTVSASMDRFVRRLDRMDTRNGNTAANSRTGRDFNSGERNKRVRYR